MAWDKAQDCTQAEQYGVLLGRSDAHASVATVVEHILQETGQSPMDPPRSVPSAVLPPPSPAPSAVAPRRSMGSTNGSMQSQYQPPQPSRPISRVRAFLPKMCPSAR